MSEKIVDADFALSYMEHVRSIIDRMASNSASAKTWCVTLVSAVLVVAADQDQRSYLLIAFIPLIVLGVLDAYYLALERVFRERLVVVARAVQNQNIRPGELYTHTTFANSRELGGGVWSALGAFPIWTVYGALTLALLIGWLVLP